MALPLDPVSARLAQRLEQPALRAPGELLPTRPTEPVAPATMDTRQPSRGALEALIHGLATGTLADPLADKPGSQAASSALSGAARLIAALVAIRPGVAPAVSGTDPLWTTPGRPEVPRLAQALAQAVTRSGLFYESHLAQFASGVRALEEMQAEPQSRLAAEPAGEPASAPLVHRDAQGLVQQQLQLLDSGVFRWQGEAWPGARMDWEIREERPGHEEGAPTDTPADRRWATTLRIGLPVLGEVEVALSLCADAVQAGVRALSGPGAEDMRRGEGELAQRLADAGLRLVGFEVREQDAEADE